MTRGGGGACGPPALTGLRGRFCTTALRKLRGHGPREATIGALGQEFRQQPDEPGAVESRQIPPGRIRFPGRRRTGDSFPAHERRRGLREARPALSDPLGRGGQRR
jgi:hypothetical protein